MTSNGTVVNCESYTRLLNISTDQGIFRCVQYNYNSSDPQMSGTVGFGSSVSLLLSVPILKANFSQTFTDDANFAIGYGLQVSFTVMGVDPPVFNESNFAQPGQNTYFMLTKTTETKIKKGSASESTYWKVRPSIVALPENNPLQKGHVNTVISFAYETLSTFALTDQISYQFTNFLGDFAGMTGTLVGLDVVKLARAILLIPVSVFRLDLTPIWETLVM